jgi:hypothetical protein
MPWPKRFVPGEIPAMSIPFACDMAAIPAGERGAHQALIRRLVTEAAEEMRQRPDGFTFRFPAKEYDAVTQFVARERLCCPFLRFALEVEPDRGPIRLHLTGPDSVVPFIRAELHLPAV